MHRDEGGDIYFRRPDGRVIPRSGYRAEDMIDDGIGADGADLDRASAEALMVAIVRGVAYDECGLAHDERGYADPLRGGADARKRCGKSLRGGARGGGRLQHSQASVAVTTARELKRKRGDAVGSSGVIALLASARDRRRPRGELGSNSRKAPPRP